MKNRKKIGLIIVAICLYFGFSTNVFAENYILETAPDSFESNTTGRALDSTGALTNLDKDAVLTNNSINALGLAQVIDYHGFANSQKIKVFCIDRTLRYGEGVTYKKTSEIVDYGIVYIITNSESYYNSIEGSATAENQDMERAWFTQIAIWKYQDPSFASRVTMNSNGIQEGTLSYNGDYYYYSKRAGILWAEADKLVNAAKTAKNPADINTFSLKFAGNYTLLENQKSIQTGLIGLEDPSSITTYSLDISKAPSGTKVYTEDGQEVTDLTSIAATTKVYMIIPIENTDTYAFDFSVPASTTNYKYYTGYKYISYPASYQPLTLVAPTTKSLSTAINLKGSKVPDTASSISNSIYFLGFIILLGGVGIIYANTKTKKEQM